MTEITNKLYEMQDIKYKQFVQKLIPTVDCEKIIGIRTPELRSFAKKLSKEPIAEQFLKSLPHNYYEENNLHSFLIEEQKDYDKTICLLNNFLPYIDNWATCDGMSPKILKLNTDKLLSEIYKWIKSKNTYTIRFGILCLLRYYLDDNFKPEYCKAVSEIKSVEYYVNMMIAWYFATALHKQYDVAIKYLEQNILNDWVHNKTISKATESLVIDKSTKDYLKTLKRKISR